MNKHKTNEVIQGTPIRADFQLTMPDVKRVPEFIEFARWCATASWIREPATQREFAKRFGVSEDSLGDWKRRPEFWPLVWRFLRERMQERIPDVIDGLYGKIVSGKGSAAEVQLFLRLAGNGTQTADGENKK
jgi:hypothetical protein